MVVCLAQNKSFASLKIKRIKNLNFTVFVCILMSYGLIYKFIICKYVSVFLTSLLLVETTDTGFSLVDLNQALEMMNWSGRCRLYGG